MKEKINTETIHYKGMKHLYPQYFGESYSTKEMLNIFEKVFPEEYRLWSRELVGGNRGAHNLND